MRYELTNRYYGHKIECTSKQAMENFIASSKKDPKDNLPVWVVTREFEDGPAKPRFSKEELLEMLEAYDEPAEKVEAQESVEPKKRGPRSKAAEPEGTEPKGKHLGDPGSSMRP